MQELEMDGIGDKGSVVGVQCMEEDGVTYVQQNGQRQMTEKASLGFLCQAKSLKGTEQRCGMVHPDFLLKSHFAMQNDSERFDERMKMD